MDVPELNMNCAAWQRCTKSLPSRVRRSPLRTTLSVYKVCLSSTHSAPFPDACPFTTLLPLFHPQRRSAEHVLTTTMFSGQKRGLTRYVPLSFDVKTASHLEQTPGTLVDSSCAARPVVHPYTVRLLQNTCADTLDTAPTTRRTAHSEGACPRHTAPSSTTLDDTTACQKLDIERHRIRVELPRT